MYEVSVEEAPARRIAALAHRGTYVEIGNAFEQASTMIGSRNLWSQVGSMIGVYLDDPSAVPAAELRSWAGYELVDEAELPKGFERVELPEGPIARLRFQGPYAGINKGYDYLFREWLPNSDRDPGDAPAYEVYLNTPLDVAPADLLTDICLPLRP